MLLQIGVVVVLRHGRALEGFRGRGAHLRIIRNRLALSAGFARTEL